MNEKYKYIKMKKIRWAHFDCFKVDEGVDGLRPCLIVCLVHGYSKFGSET